MNSARATATDIILRHIVPSFLCGYLLLAFFSLNYGEAVRRIQQEGHMTTVVLVMLLCGLGTAGINTFYHLVLRCRIVGSFAGSTSRASSRLRHAGIGAAVGLVCGSSTIVTALSNWGLLISTVFLVLLTIGHLKRFARSVVTMLKPGRYCMWPEILGLVEIYITIIACFTLINATLEIAHRGGLLTNPQFPFSVETGVFADAVYFTVVTMTTLGFGDITPISPGAKLLTTLECLVGYVMFALTVGIITRGVVGSDDENL
ncbi:potassium channel family protein [Pseudodesulfovibrio senegalensis]|nr:potassium channel family protein [Pseudodesulfovibrio senegalensis]